MSNENSSSSHFMMTRRNFATALSAGTIGLYCPSLLASKCGTCSCKEIPYTASADGKRWFKGNTHMHTLRSDGDAFPIEAAALFKRDGYNFICLTDHNVTASELFKPFAVESGKGKKVTEKIKAAFERDFPGLELCRKIRDNAGRELYSSASSAEVAKLLDEKGRFLVISGNEVTAAPTAGNELHCNIIGLDEPCRAKNERTVGECLDWIRGEYKRFVRNAPDAILTLNHPLWVSYDVPPQLVADRADIGFFEVCNSGSMPRFNLPGQEFTHDKWWDVVNTIRALRGEALVYAVACDDIHGYNPLRNGKMRRAGYVQVLAETLSKPSVFSAMRRGDFYASTGLDLESVAFDRQSRTLTVSADPKFGDDCRIEFIGSKQGADISVKEVVKWQIEGELNSWLVNSRKFSRQRSVERYSEEIGQTLKIAKGRKASYTLQPDDLYVRAKVVSPANAETDNREPQFAVAWTQPILNEKRR